MCFDERGRMFVCEGRSYPSEPGDGTGPQGVIALLEPDAQGNYTKRKVFADGLNFPSGIMPWRGGILVAAPPDVIWLKDNDGDGVADVRRVLFSGFNNLKTAQHHLNHLTLGLDNWVYGSDGMTAESTITVPEKPDRAPVVSQKTDWRFRPDTLDIEPVSGLGQYGLTFDELGHKFVASNRNPLMQVIMKRGYLKRNPYLPFSDVQEDVAEFAEAGRVFPVSPDTTLAGFLPQLMGKLHAGTFTSACSSFIHCGTALSPDHAGNVFVCEPAQNLVQRQRLTPSGPIYKSTRVSESADFLASPDTWCRPVFVCDGPDGALYICDMYRKVIDHRKFFPQGVYQATDFEAGKGMGRIYRVVGASAKRQPLPKLADASSAELVALLAHDNGWTRDTARRLLLERNDSNSIPLLKQAVTSASSDVARLLALCTLDGLNQLDDATLLAALNDKWAGVRENAIRIAEPRVAKSAAFNQPLLKLAADPDAHVRFQAALTIGELRDVDVVPALATIAAQDMASRWSRAAVLSSLGDKSGPFMHALLQTPAARASDAMPLMMADLGRILGASQSPEQCLALINEIASLTDEADARWQPAALTGIAEGLRGRVKVKAGQTVLAALSAGDSPAAASARQHLEAVMKRSSAIATDEKQPMPARLAAITLLGQSSYDSAGAALQSLIAPNQPSELQLAAVREIGRLGDARGVTALITKERWSSFTGPVREAILGVLLSRTQFITALFDAIDAGAIAPTALNPTRRNQLLKNRDKAVVARTEKTFASITGGNRQKVYEDYKSILTLTPDPRNGHAMFKKVCAQCHTYAGEGIAVGPDLTGVRNMPADALLLHIIIPNYEIVAGYQLCTVETKDGRTLAGLIASESDTSVTLRGPSGVTDTVLRAQIKTINLAPISLMPDELEKTMTKQELRDIIGFLNMGDTAPAPGSASSTTAK
jgi:putative membrane-bound dehydrogenase-like protein